MKFGCFWQTDNNKFIGMAAIWPLTKKTTNSMKRILYTLLTISILLENTIAQQLPFDNQYLINKFSLSPAYAGFTNNTELFLGFRQNWVGIAGAPQKQMLNINMPIKEKGLGLGMVINNEKMGNFSNFYFLPTLAYHQPLSSDMSINFGINAEIYRNQYNFSQAKSGTIDPLIQKLQALMGTTFNVGAGFMFQFKGLHLGVSVPRTLNSKVVYNSEVPGLTYTLSRHYLAHLSYYHKINDKISVEPVVIARSTDQSPLLYEAGISAKFADRIWTNIGYRKGNDFIISAGAAISPYIAIHYSYEFSNSGLVQLSSGTHEISIGFLLKKTKKQNPPLTIFTLKDENQVGRDTILQKRVEVLEAQLASCACEEKAEMITQLDNRLKKLESNLDDLDAETWEKPFIMNNIKFANNSAQLFASSYGELNKLADKIKRDPELIIKITGYTDNVGSPKYNTKLSLDRANSVKAYLVKEGIEDERIVTEGKGDENPIASNETPTGRAQNRRIEGQFKK